MKRNPFIVGFVIFLGLGLFFLFVVSPRSAEATMIKSQIAAEQARLVALEAEVTSLTVAAEQGTFARDLDAARQAIPGTPELPKVLASLAAAASEAGVGLGGVSPGAPTTSSAGAASVIPLSLTVSGDYFALARFLFNLETEARLTKVTSISISGGSEGSLLMQLTAEVYTTDLNAGPGSDPAPGREVGA